MTKIINSNLPGRHGSKRNSRKRVNVRLARFRVLSLLGLSVLIGLVIGLASCASTKVYDKSIPKEQSADLILSYPLLVTHFDGEEVNWSSGGFGTAKSTITIPAGEHVLIFKHAGGGGVKYSLDEKTVVVSHTFEALHIYLTLALPTGNFEVRIEDMTGQEDLLKNLP
jgi:hypothetical protein